MEFSYNYYEKSYEIFDDKDIEMFIGFGTVAKYYFLDKDISPFIKIGYSYNIYNLTDSYFHNRKSFSGYSAVIGAGLNYFLANSLALESSLDYVYSQKQIEIGVENGSVFITSNKKTFKLSIGLLYFL